MIFHENTILKKYHTIFFSKNKKNVAKMSSVAVVICALGVNGLSLKSIADNYKV